MSNLQTAIRRDTARGRLAKLVLEFASEKELVKADKIFARPGMSFADCEFLHEIAFRANGT